eukprot:106917-Rhodomonas_salina.1
MVVPKLRGAVWVPLTRTTVQKLREAGRRGHRATRHSRAQRWPLRAGSEEEGSWVSGEVPVGVFGVLRELSDFDLGPASGASVRHIAPCTRSTRLCIAGVSSRRVSRQTKRRTANLRHKTLRSDGA